MPQTTGDKAISERPGISVVTLGCEKNTVDSEVIMGMMARHGLRLEPDAERADTIIINTCGFIDVAKRESVNAVLEAVELKKQGQVKNVFVAGCLSERYRSELELELPEVDRFFGTQDFESILKELVGNQADLRYDLLGERQLTTPKHFAYMKISEGCDNPCSFCAIPIMRGGHRSRSIEELEFEAMMLASNGVKEIVLIAQDSTYYGLDLYGSRALSKLLERLARINGIEWIRLMYAYPAKFPMDILDVIASEPKIAKYLDIPVQHASTEVLKSMRRGITRRTTEDLIGKIRDRVPGITLRTTLITGYPAEGEREFAELEEFIETMQFDRLGVFTYSQEEGTTAHPLGDPVPQEEKLRRQARLYELQSEISLEKNLAKIGRIERVLVERSEELSEGNEESNIYYGRTEADAPEVDNEVRIISNREIPMGEFARVQITGAMEHELEGVLK
ncbi:MAG TPA: 30S ribosomal protein S12 methylthiotransferase RimO [Candidatus Kapabacteria bacterium]|jgi:ribosomal protein S12 methylthiotransferase|nr:30S ribosomal protein S12 methylthiotransferase RimO [Candidatus Kapabacteria bacterium]